MPLELFEVVTLKEASDAWGVTPRAIQLRLMRHENVNPDDICLRRSGGTWLTTISVMRKVYGEPIHPRRDYES